MNKSIFSAILAGLLLFLIYPELSPRSELLAQTIRPRVQRACGELCTPPGTQPPASQPYLFCTPGLLCKNGVCVNPQCGPRFQCCTIVPTNAAPTPVSTIPPFKLTPTDAVVTPYVPTSNPSQQPTDTLVGDCSGLTPGVRDGVVNLLDIEYFRKELNNEVTTLSCDFDFNRIVDVIDFANYLRVGYGRNSGNNTTTPVPPTPMATITLVTPISTRP